MNHAAAYPKAFVPAAVLGLLAILLVAATDFKNIERGILVFGLEALASGLVVVTCIKLTRMAWSWPMAVSAVVGVFLLLAALVPLLVFQR